MSDAAGVAGGRVSAACALLWPLGEPIIWFAAGGERTESADRNAKKQLAETVAVDKDDRTSAVRTTLMPVQAAPHARSAVELKSIIEAERKGAPFLLWRDAAGIQQIMGLEAQERATVGRQSSSDVTLSDDGEVSRTHAVLELVGQEWAVTDDGLSRNGTFLNGTRISGRKRLADGDTIRFGKVVVEYRCPTEGSTALTDSASYLPTVESLTPTQRKILVALCRPYRAGEAYATPASNNQIASEVFLGVDAVKNHLRVLFQRFEIASLPQNQKRARLVECAFQWGLVAERDL